MSKLTVEVDAAEAGLDAERLARIDAHFARYVTDGRLPGWLLTVRRGGRLAHVARCGSRDLEAGLPVTDDTLWRITTFWVDADADLTVSFFTQLLPSSTYPIRPQLRQLVYQALVS